MAREPLYKKAETEMLRRIETGEWPVGTRLGNEFELAGEFGVSQGTMRRALITLESMGHLHRKPGRGTIVADPAPTPERATSSGPVQISLTALDGSALDLTPYRARSTTRHANAVESSLFGSSKLQVLTRTLRQGGQRFALDEIAVPASLSDKLDDALPSQFEDILQEIGLGAATIEDSLEAQQISMGDSVALSTDRHTALLCVTRTARDTNGTAIARQVLRLAGPARYGVTAGS